MGQDLKQRDETDRGRFVEFTDREVTAIREALSLLRDQTVGTDWTVCQGLITEIRSMFVERGGGMSTVTATSTIRVEIKSRWDGSVLYAADIPADTPSDMHTRAALEKATAGGAYLRGAYLRGTYLGGADLRGADLRGADLRGTDLRGTCLRGVYLGDADLGDADLGDADLRDADLRGTCLRGTYLGGADLRGTCLRGTYLGGADLRGVYLGGADRKLLLVGQRPYLSIGPIGSEFGALESYMTDDGVYVRRGCFFGSLDEFRAAVEDRHGDNKHADEYGAAIQMIEAHARVWAQAE